MNISFDSLFNGVYLWALGWWDNEFVLDNQKPEIQTVAYKYVLCVFLCLWSPV